MVLSQTQTRHHLTKAKSPILRAADKAEPAIRRAMLDALEALQRSVPNLEDLIASGNIKSVVDAVKGAGIPRSLMNALTDATATAAIGGAEAAGFEIGFNLPNARAVEWAAAHAGEQITLVTQATKAVVQEIVEDALLRGIHPRVAARQIKNVVPLLPQHQKSVTRLFNSSIDAGVTVSHAEKIAARKSKKLLKYRAEMIARTEAIRASNMGQQLVWQQAIDLDLLPQGVKKIWLATGDDRTCPVCAVMDGQTVEVSGGEFNVNRQATGFVRSGSSFRVSGTKPYRGWGKQASPPAHPQCRCTMILETIDTPGRTQPQTPLRGKDDLPFTGNGEMSGKARVPDYNPKTGEYLGHRDVDIDIDVSLLPEHLQDATRSEIMAALDDFAPEYRPPTVRVHDAPTGSAQYGGEYVSRGFLVGKDEILIDQKYFLVTDRDLTHFIHHETGHRVQEVLEEKLVRAGSGITEARRAVDAGTDQVNAALRAMSSGEAQAAGLSYPHYIAEAGDTGLSGFKETFAEVIANTIEGQQTPLPLWDALEGTFNI